MSGTRLTKTLLLEIVTETVLEEDDTIDWDSDSCHRPMFTTWTWTSAVVLHLPHVKRRKVGVRNDILRDGRRGTIPCVYICHT
jgi:hypothetical protein